MFYGMYGGGILPLISASKFNSVHFRFQKYPRSDTSVILQYITKAYVHYIDIELKRFKAHILPGTIKLKYHLAVVYISFLHAAKSA